MHKLKLTIIGAAEDIPRLVTAAGKGCDGSDLVLIWRPHDLKLLLAIKPPKGSALVWVSDTSDLPEGVKQKKELTDAPMVPRTEVTARQLSAMAARLKGDLPKTGPELLRGEWSGHLICDDVPVVELTRRLAPYATLTLRSRPGEWMATVRTKQTWFAAAEEHSSTDPHFYSAILAGLRRSYAMVGQACSMRDTRRRAPLDPEYAAKHPPKERAAPQERAGSLIDRWVANADKPPRKPRAATEAKAAPAKPAPPTKAAPATKPTPVAKAAPPKAAAPSKPAPATKANPEPKRTSAPRQQQFFNVFKAAAKELAAELAGAAP